MRTERTEHYYVGKPYHYATYAVDGLIKNFLAIIQCLGLLTMSCHWPRVVTPLPYPTLHLLTGLATLASKTKSFAKAIRIARHNGSKQLKNCILKDKRIDTE